MGPVIDPSMMRRIVSICRAEDAQTVMEQWVTIIIEEIESHPIREGAMLAQYITIAVEQATCEFLPDDQIYYCEVPDLPGVWGSGDSHESALEDLKGVIADWVSLGLKMKQPILILGGIDLNTEHYQHA